MPQPFPWRSRWPAGEAHQDAGGRIGNNTDHISPILAAQGHSLGKGAPIVEQPFRIRAKADEQRAIIYRTGPHERALSVRKVFEPREIQRVERIFGKGKNSIVVLLLRLLQRNGRGRVERQPRWANGRDKMLRGKLCSRFVGDASHFRRTPLEARMSKTRLGYPFGGGYEAGNVDRLLQLEGFLNKLRLAQNHIFAVGRRKTLRGKLVVQRS